MVLVKTLKSGNLRNVMTRTLKSILLTTLLAGTLDIVAACIHAYLAGGTKPDQVLKYIASGALGKSAFTGGIEIVLLGLLFHFIIAFACTVCFYWAYPRLSVLKINMGLNSVLIAMVAWLVTTQVIVRFSQIGPRTPSLKGALIAIAILIVCIGLPIAWRAKVHFDKA